MKKIIKNKAAILFLIFLATFLIAQTALALELDWPAPPGGKSLNVLEREGKLSFPATIEYFYRWGIALGGLAAFVSLVMAGFQYLTSVGNETKMRDAKERINSAVLGLVLLLSSFLILNAINPELTTLKMPSLEAPSDTLEPYDEEELIITKKCSKVLVFPEPDYHGTAVLEINKGGTAKGILIEKDRAYSIRFIYPDEGGEEGSCRVELHKTPTCKDDPPMFFLTNDWPDLSNLYLSNDIKCIKVE
jgi:hypothetical protein